jgi:putative transcriptional regulator
MMENARLLGLRKETHLSQKDVAEMIGISQSMLARIESGQRDPRKPIKIELARLFNKTVEWLFYESEYYPQS